MTTSHPHHIPLVIVLAASSAALADDDEDAVEVIE